MLNKQNITRSQAKQQPLEQFVVLFEQEEKKIIEAIEKEAAFYINQCKAAADIAEDESPYDLPEIDPRAVAFHAAMKRYDSIGAILETRLKQAPETALNNLKERLGETFPDISELLTGHVLQQESNVIQYPFGH